MQIREYPDDLIDPVTGVLRFRDFRLRVIPHIEEGFFRYDGPKPSFKESVIVSLADAIEAASRNLTEINA